MTAIQSRNSVLAIVVETTEGTLKSPSSADEFVSMQDDADLAYGIDTLENAELTGSIGPAKSIRGLENPAFSFSHYLRGSGATATAPDYGDLLQAAFGTESIAAAEFNTVGGSTTTAIEVDTGEGASFQEMEPILIQHSAFDHEIAVIKSISGDTLTPLFALQNAPATGTDLGRAVLYTPADTGHQTLSVFKYDGNGGAIEASSGNRVVNTTIDFAAGELINANYSLEGIKGFFDPIDVTATDTFLDFTSDNGTFAAEITAKQYTDPDDLATALTDAMNLADPLETFAVTYSDTTGQYTVATSTSALLSLLWNSGGNTANTVGDVIGFDTSADDTGSLSYLGDNAIDLSAQFTPSIDSADPIVAKNHAFYIGTQDQNICFEASTVGFTMATPKRDILSVCAETGKKGSVINTRVVELTTTALLDQYDVDKFHKFHSNTDIQFQYNFGEKSANNWVKTKCGSLASPSAVISDFDIADDDGLFTLSLTIQVFVNAAADDEIGLGFV